VITWGKTEADNINYMKTNGIIMYGKGTESSLIIIPKEADNIDSELIKLLPLIMKSSS
jgi:hypothetical protein